MRKTGQSNPDLKNQLQKKRKTMSQLKFASQSPRIAKAVSNAIGGFCTSSTQQQRPIKVKMIGTHAVTRFIREGVNARRIAATHSIRFG
jgi:hypothetical protein